MGSNMLHLSNTLKKLWKEGRKIGTNSGNKTLGNNGSNILTNLPETERGNRSIVLFTDYYTKWVEAFSIPNELTITIADKLISGIMCRHGTPERIISNRGDQFTSDIWKEVTELLGMKLSMTTPYNPMADGQAERAIGTLHNTLSKMAGVNQREMGFNGALCSLGT